MVEHPHKSHCRTRTRHINLGKTEESSGCLRKPGLNRGLVGGLVPGSLRHPETHSVCVRQDRASNRPENWLSRFLDPEQSETVWGHLGPPQAS